ncbi:MAG: restriction system modified-DNA reader domain-containing protein [Acidimicrobiales bacterium]
MPIFELRDGGLVPFARLHPGPDLYEREIEELVWGDLEAFAGQSLLPVARQPHIVGGGVPDILALDEDGRVVVIEIKRDIDRGQLAQCLEYAGWARLTNLDELASLYDTGLAKHGGVEAFFRDWQDFTDTATPLTINPQPRLILIARDFEGRTRSAVDFLREYSLPVVFIPVTIYEDATGRRVIDIEADHEPVVSTVAGTGAVLAAPGLSHRRVTVMDLLSAGLLEAGEPVEFPRPRLGTRHTAVIRADGAFELPDGTRHASPSRAAASAAAVVSYDGWRAWRVPRLGGTKLDELRESYEIGTGGE